ncbi:alpha/beta fold hydrolase [Crocinitomix catalasitica]|uniref:alpha/beta fold hydrolase n=1 Tax=Crocinitomix catalasitica TaxID=184607 RepID=UPI000684AF8A|nr:alpha/beta hydrolase [Crocinitomix catalasitica]
MMQEFKGVTGSLFFKQLGIGEPVVLLHGFLEDHHIFDAMTPQLIDLGYQVILIDLPGHGSSRFQGEICTMEFMAGLVNELFDQLKIDYPFIFGHSMGGYVALELLKLRTAKICLLHSNFWEDDAEKKNNRNRVAKIVATNKSLFINESIPSLFYQTNRSRLKVEIEQLKKIALKLAAEEIIAVTRGLRDRKDNTILLNHHSISIIQGEYDPVIPNNKLNEAVEQAAIKPEIIQIPNVGHMSFLEAPAALFNAMKLVLFK